MKNLLCLIGIHRPLKVMDAFFLCKITNKMIFHAECSCGKKFMTDNINGWKGFKVERKLARGFKGYEQYGHPDKWGENEELK